MSTRTQKAVTALALSLAFATPAIADFGPPRAPMMRRDDHALEEARAELAQLRGELGYYQAAYTELSRGLDQIDAANRASRDRRSMTAIQRVLRGARDRAAQYVQPWSADQQAPAWRNDTDWRYAPDWTATTPAVVAAPTAMTGNGFGSLSSQVEQASFASEKLALVQTAAASNYFTVAQVVQLMQLASFDDTRIEIAAACAPRIVDGQRWFEVYGALSFSSSRDTLRKRLGQ